MLQLQFYVVSKIKIMSKRWAVDLVYFIQLLAFLCLLSRLSTPNYSMDSIRKIHVSLLATKRLHLSHLSVKQTDYKSNFYILLKLEINVSFFLGSDSCIRELILFNFNPICYLAEISFQYDQFLLSEFLPLP
jgi:hypothetical protein